MDMELLELPQAQQEVNINSTVDTTDKSGGIKIKSH